LKDEGYTDPEIMMATNHHDTNIRRWIDLMKKVLKELYPENIYINQSKYLIIWRKSYESKRLLSVTIHNMVITCSCRIHIQETEICRFNKSQRD
ncbi:MAG TPA: hypothetical protein VN704_02940, partial [Verrucomicrobiae bacterium]|nr:hypothetical protein [Verrucomicrobiae bacterium]